MPEKSPAFEYAPGTRWTFVTDLAEFEHVLVVRRRKEDAQRGTLIEVVVGVVDEWFDCLERAVSCWV